MRVDEKLSLQEFGDVLLRLAEVSVRAALTRTDSGGWLMQSMVLTVAPDTPSVDWAVYDYGHIAFVAEQVLGSQIKHWLTNQGGEIAGFDFEIPELNEQIRSERLPSHARYRGFDGLWQPHTYYEAYGKFSRFEPPRERVPLVQEGCPSFPTLGVAVYKLLYDLDKDPDNSFPNNAVSLSVAHTKAWIERVEQHPSSLVITVMGDNVEAVRLEVTGSRGIRFDEKLDGPGDFRFELPDGLPSRLWVLLSQENRWLDLRELNQYGSRSAWDNVLDVGADLATQVAGAIARGEGEQTEFKEQLPSGDDKFLRVVAAFANGDGGMILVGVADRTGEIKGLTSDPNDLRDRISQMVRDKVIPNPKVKIEVCDVSERKVLAIIVEKGEEPPYGVGSDPTKLRYHVRRGATTPLARQDEIRAMITRTESRTDASDYDWA